MPNKVKRYKRGVASKGTVHVEAYRKSDSVKALLSPRGGPILARVKEKTARHAHWRKWLQARLPDETFVHISGVVERDTTLVVFTESAAWSARVRYAMAEIETLIKEAHSEIQRVEIRVMPRS